jgi:hypothetical protein
MAAPRSARCTRCSKARWPCCRAACFRPAEAVGCSTPLFASPLYTADRRQLPALPRPAPARLPGAQPARRRRAGLARGAAPAGRRPKRPAAAAGDGTVRFAPGAVQPGRPGSRRCRPGRRARAAGGRLRARAAAPRIHRPLGHHVRLRRPGLHLLAHGGQAAAGGAGMCVRGRRPAGARTAGAAGATTAACATAWATARAPPSTAPSRPTPTATRPARAARSSPA